MARIDRIRELVSPRCAEFGLELYDLDFVGGVLRITVDRADGVGMDDIAGLTREISRMFDDEDPIDGHYTLEVSSPGLERQLRTPAHFVRATGDRVKVKLRSSIAGDRRIEGVIVSADGHAVVLDLGKSSDDTVTSGDTVTRSVSYDEIEKARTVFEWGPTPPKGRAKSNAKHKSSDSVAAKVVNS